MGAEGVGWLGMVGFVWFADEVGEVEVVGCWLLNIVAE